MEQIICIDSSQRRNPDKCTPGEYTVYLDTDIKNVISIELVFAIYEKITPDTYVSLFIDEIVDSYIISNSSFIRRAFTILPMMDYINTYTISNYRSIAYFPDKPILKLSKMSLRFTTPCGKVYPMRDHLLRFEVKTTNNVRIPEIFPDNSRNPYTILQIPLGSILNDTDLLNVFKLRYKELKKLGISGKTDPRVLQLKEAYLTLKQGVS